MEFIGLFQQRYQRTAALLEDFRRWHADKNAAVVAEGEQRKERHREQWLRVESLRPQLDLEASVYLVEVVLVDVSEAVVHGTRARPIRRIGSRPEKLETHLGVRPAVVPTRRNVFFPPPGSLESLGDRAVDPFLDWEHDITALRDLFTDVLEELALRDEAVHHVGRVPASIAGITEQVHHGRH